MKGLILAAGLGTRLRPITSLRPKPTINVANRPLIHYAVDNLADVGIREIGVVVSYDTINVLKDTLQHYGRGVRFEYLIQNPPMGLAHAVSVSRDFLGDDPFVMYLSDNLFEHGISDFVTAFEAEGGGNAVLALVPVDDPRAFGVAEVEGGRVARLVEKPSEPKSDLAVAGVYVLDHNIHTMIEGLEPGAKGEYQITDAIQRLIEHGFHVAPQQVRGWWKDTGKAEDILDANRLELLKLRRDIRGELHNAEVVGDVIIEQGAVVRDTTIFGPALIGAGAQLENAYIGPFTTIGNGVVIRNAELEYTVVGDHTRIEGVKPRIQASLIGEDVHIAGHSGRPSTHRLIIGDKSQVILQEL
jgi:glucose-1-phosphate thymidylyltransferase